MPTHPHEAALEYPRLSCLCGVWCGGLSGCFDAAMIRDRSVPQLACRVVKSDTVGRWCLIFLIAVRISQFVCVLHSCDASGCLPRLVLTSAFTYCSFRAHKQSRSNNMISAATATATATATIEAPKSGASIP